jgi:hypothetical protein
MELKINAQPGIWKFALYTSVWRSTGYIEFVDENGGVVGVTRYDSQVAADGQSQYRKINLLYSSDEAHTITIHTSPSCAFDGYAGNMSVACVTVERFLDHVEIEKGESPDIRTTLTAKAYVSPDSSLEFHTYDGVNFQWQIGDSVNGPFTNLTGETASSYKPVIAQTGKYLRAEITFNGAKYYAITPNPISDLVFTPVFYDGRGDVVSSLNGSPMSAKLKYHNKTGEELTLNMFVAIYGSGGKLKYIASDQITFGLDELGEFAVPLAFTTEVGDYARVLVWKTDYVPERVAFPFD